MIIQQLIRNPVQMAIAGNQAREVLAIETRVNRRLAIASRKFDNQQQEDRCRGEKQKMAIKISQVWASKMQTVSLELANWGSAFFTPPTHALL
jgi:hypothetical protein